MQKDLIIAVDGPSGVGKSSVSRLLARHYGLRYVDTGAIYRAVAVRVGDEGMDLDDEGAIRSLLSSMVIDVEDGDRGFRIFIDGRELTGRIRSPEAGRLASRVSSIRAVREALIDLQRGLGRGGAVVEGRDIGTVVFPDAPVKFFLTASFEKRVERRYHQLKRKGIDVDMEDLRKEMMERDRRDSERRIAPLKMAVDAIEVDTTSLSLEEVFNRMVKVIDERTGSGG